jgi:geranylgeranyl reductase family protein
VDDIVIAGAGPAGAFAAAILARAGLKVRLFDRSRFPRHKLCGDTLNPGALSVLRRHLAVDSLIANSDSIRGMLLTGPGGARVRGEYGHGIAGRSITRKVFDEWLLKEALAAGAQLEEGVSIRDVAISNGRINGVIAGVNGQSRTHHAKIVIAADGRRSTIAAARGLSRTPRRPRRWAIGAYFTNVGGMTSLGEMHVRRGHYIGVAPVPGGLTNACLVVPHATGDSPIANPDAALHAVLNSDPQLKTRFEHANPVEPAVMLGPMAVDTTAAGQPGLLLAGDAAGFIDPMTGDGLRFAFVGAEIAAALAKEVLEGKLPVARAHLELANRRRSSFASKWRFNRTMRSLVASPSSVTGAAAVARVWPSAFAQMIRYAGDC